MSNWRRSRLQRSDRESILASGYIFEIQSSKGTRRLPKSCLAKIFKKKTSLKSAQDELTLRVSWARGDLPGVKASGPAVLITETNHLEIVSREAAENGSREIRKSWSDLRKDVVLRRYQMRARTGHHSLSPTTDEKSDRRRRRRRRRSTTSIEPDVSDWFLVKRRPKESNEHPDLPNEYAPERLKEHEESSYVDQKQKPWERPSRSKYAEASQSITAQREDEPEHPTPWEDSKLVSEVWRRVSWEKKNFKRTAIWGAEEIKEPSAKPERTATIAER